MTASHHAPPAAPPAAPSPPVTRPRHAAGPTDWLAQEPGVRASLAELRRLLGRARLRPVRTLGIALLAGAATAGWGLMRKPLHTETLVFRVVEPHADVGARPSTRAKLKDFTWDVVFSRGVLEETVRMFRLYPSLRAIGVPLAVERFRDRLDVDVYRNYFVDAWRWGDTFRSARLRVTFADPDPALARRVIRHLAGLVASRGVRERRREVADAAGVAARLRAAARARLDRLIGEQMARRALLPRSSGARAAQLKVALLRGEDDLKEARARVAQLDQVVEDADLRVALERRSMGLRYQQVAARGTPPPRLSRGASVALMGVLAFALVLPFAAAGVGAFDARVLDGADVARLGLRLLGRLPSFPGDRFGALPHRRGSGGLLE